MQHFDISERIQTYRGISQPTISAKCDFATEGQINDSIIDSGSIRPDRFIPKNVIHSRPDECFDSLRSYAC